MKWSNGIRFAALNKPSEGASQTRFQMVGASVKKRRYHMTRGSGEAPEGQRLWEADRKSKKRQEMQQRTKCNSPHLLLNLLAAGDFPDCSEIVEWCATGRVTHCHLFALSKEKNLEEKKMVADNAMPNINKRYCKSCDSYCVRHLLVQYPIVDWCGVGVFHLTVFWTLCLFKASGAKLSEHKQKWFKIQCKRKRSSVQFSSSAH